MKRKIKPVPPWDRDKFEERSAIISVSQKLSWAEGEKKALDQMHREMGLQGVMFK